MKRLLLLALLIILNSFTFLWLVPHAQKDVNRLIMSNLFYSGLYFFVGLTISFIACHLYLKENKLLYFAILLAITCFIWSYIIYTPVCQPCLTNG